VDDESVGGALELAIGGHVDDLSIVLVDAEECRCGAM
jgi:hypothetical protein